MKITGGSEYVESVQKLQRIKAFDRLLGLSKIKNYRGRPLDDRTLQGTIHCVKTWLTLNDQKFVQNCGMFTLQCNDAEIVFDVSHTIGLSQQQVKTRDAILSAGGEYFCAVEFSDFLKHWDELF